jgi:flagellin
MNLGGVGSAQHQLTRMASAQFQALTKLSTGLRINRGADDPAGLISSENLRAQLAAIEAEGRAAQRTQQVARVADGAIGAAGAMLYEAKALAVANGGGFLSDAERQANQMQIDSILQSVDRVGATTSFNGQELFNGEMTLGDSGRSVELGRLSADHLGEIEVDGETYRLADVASGGALDQASPEFGDVAVQVIDRAIGELATRRAEIGAFVQGVEHGEQARLIEMEQTAAANSIIRDTDFARQTAELMRTRTLHAAAVQGLSIVQDSHSRVLDLLA